MSNEGNQRVGEFIGIVVLSYIFIAQFTRNPPLELTLLFSIAIFFLFNYYRKRKEKLRKKYEDEEVIELD